MRISGPVALASVPAVPWKNGGGTTRTLSVVPEGASLEDFLWRVSLARIDEAGPFSSYPGVDRTILLWQGSGMLLRSPSWQEHSLTEALQPFAFRGEDAVFCSPLGSSAEDLNLMVRRGAVTGSVSSHSSDTVLDGAAEDAVILCAAGVVRVGAPDDAGQALLVGQYLRLSEVESPVGIKVEASETRFVCLQVKRANDPAL